MKCGVCAALCRAVPYGRDEKQCNEQGEGRDAVEYFPDFGSESCRSDSPG